ncbi:hypothetical protein MBLNU457_3473t2 [Dothideomycetes sp. NU457]
MDDGLRFTALADMVELERKRREVLAAKKDDEAEYSRAKLQYEASMETYATTLQDIDQKLKVANEAYTNILSGDSTGTYTQVTQDVSQTSLDPAHGHAEEQTTTSVRNGNTHAKPAASEDMTMEDQDELSTGQLSDRSVVSQQQRVSAGRRSLSNDASASNKGPFARGYKAHDTIRQTPTVVLTSAGVWIEMRCPVCKGNATQTSTYFKGVRGLRTHLWYAHGSQGDTIAREPNAIFIELCKHAVVSDEMAIKYENWPSKPEDPSDDPIPVVPWVVDRKAVRPEQQFTPSSTSNSRSSSPDIPLAARTPTAERICDGNNAKKTPPVGIKRTFSERSSAIQDFFLGQQVSRKTDERVPYASARTLRLELERRRQERFA